MNRFLPSAILVLIVCTAVSAQEPTSAQAPAAPVAADTTWRGDSVVDSTADLVEPTLDLADLRRRVVYPEWAKNNGVEGRVVLRVLVGFDGAVERVRVDQSAGDSLDNAAIEAVTHASFTPGYQFNKPLRLWVMVPFDFRLED